VKTKKPKARRIYVLVNDDDLWTRGCAWDTLDVYRYRCHAIDHKEMGERVVAYDCVPAAKKARKVKP